MSASDPPAVVVAPRPPQVGHNFELGKGGGGPPPLATAVLSHLAAGWPALADLRAAASARRGSGRLRNEISALVCDVRVALAAAFLGGLPDSGGASPQLAAEDEQLRAEWPRVSTLMLGRCWWTAGRRSNPIGTCQTISRASFGPLWNLSSGQQRWLGRLTVVEVSAARSLLRGLSGWRSSMAPLSSSRRWRTVFGSTRLLMASAFWDMARIPTMIIPFIQILRCSGL